MRVLVACEFSGIVREAFRKQGHDAWSCDIIESEIPGNHIQGNVLEILGLGWDLMVAHPPCTYLTVSGNRWYHDKHDLIDSALKFVTDLANAPVDKIAIENPVGRLSTLWRKPDQYIQPWMFGHGETKKTGLWLKNLPLLTETTVVEGRFPRVHKEPPSENRWKERSRTYQGIADAMAEQWGKE